MPLSNSLVNEALGHGHITIFGWMYNAVTGSWTEIIDLTYMVLGCSMQTVGNLNSISFQVYLVTGTYTLRFRTITAASRAIVDIDIDGVEVASFDLYAASSSYNILKTQTGISITTPGLKVLKFRLDGKNASSSNFYFDISEIALWRTA